MSAVYGSNSPAPWARLFVFVMASCSAPALSSAFCANSLTVIQDFCRVCTRSATSVLKKLLHDSTQQQATLPCPTCFEQVPLPIQDLPIGMHLYLSNNAITARRVSQLKTAKTCGNCMHVTSKRRRVPSVATAATVDFRSASSAWNSTRRSGATRSTRSLA